MTAGNGNTNSSRHRGESKPAQAIVKSHILTHLIEGFVIQEGAEPFPVERPSFSVDCLRRDMSDSRMNGLPPKDLKARQEPMLTCELCGKVDFAYIFKRSKRFCSTLCAKRYNVGCTKRIGLFSNRKSTVEDTKKQKGLNENPQNSSLELEDKTSSCVRKSAGHVTHPAQGESSQCSDLSSNKQDRWGPRAQGTEVPRDPGQWNVDDVYVFICSLPGCLEIAEGFRSQEIDGQALLLLKEDHLVGAMNIKLGPALKIAAQIGMLKDL
ncbi:polyhomeotic-like protein 2 isoform X1 [Hippocampus zosterae]|uniref:polyhomeotic-like protein 2 isoform X1 n=1 Tax=Hippocampus zosterae TaxID=109293 RepID=UPI00223D2128|nr:polyhomeotic-like protein 2 isoform X1 [Hippocampus zosterae]XP_051909830.1 polyhomeotic-like protein 2 isoform X1 [Hippocampus zosterae]